MIRDEYLGVLPKPLLTLQFPWQESEAFGHSRLDIQQYVEQMLNKIVKANWNVYVFKERGSFSKNLSLLTDNGTLHSVGILSRSLIIYIFFSGNQPKGIAKEIQQIIESISRSFSTPIESITRVYINGKSTANKSLF